MSDTEIDPTQQHADPLGEVELRLAADLAQLPVVRSVVGTVAGRADFDMDTIADLRLAVDEACSTLIAAARPGVTLVCRFHVADESLRFHGAVPSATDEPPSTTSFGWQVLTTLVGSADARVEEGDDGAPWLHIELTRTKTESVG